MSAFNLTIGYLYPDRMNIYGDRGNIITLTQRLKWRGIDVLVTEIKVGDTLKTNTIDLYFFGGGQDQAQTIVAEDLQSKAETIKTDIETGVVALAICGGYQLFGNYYQDQAGHKTEGIGIFDATTVAGPRRMIGNLRIETAPLQTPILDKTAVNAIMPLTKQTHDPSIGYKLEIIGFENHSGQTVLGPKAAPFGRVIKGFGNNGQDNTEGIRYKNSFGCYLHGSLLPKNPLFADYLLEKALQRKYENFMLKALKNDQELATFIEAKSRFGHNKLDL